MGSCHARYENSDICWLYIEFRTKTRSVSIENIRRLTGHTASIDDIKQLTYMAYRFSTKIKAVETVKDRNFYLENYIISDKDKLGPCVLVR